MIVREIYRHLQYQLARSDSVALLGPRQVGKTTLARQIASEWGDGTQYLDLEARTDRDLLGDNPLEYFSRYSDQLVVLDEVHRTPNIFQDLRVQIDEHRRNNMSGRFLILGSASISLLRQSTESLAGRISFFDMAPLILSEVWNHSSSNSENSNKVISQLWLQGGFPLAYLQNAKDSMRWRNDFIRSYLERDLPQFGLRVSTDRMDLFWQLIANDQGGLFNAQRYTKILKTSGNTVRHYLETSRQLLMVRVLQPWFGNLDKRLVKTPRIYIRDSGILHALLGLHKIENLVAHPLVGKSWEGFVIENLIEAARGEARPYFYRTSAGTEIDLVLEFGAGECWAFEIKISDNPSLTRGFHIGVRDIQARRQIVVVPGKESFRMHHNVEVMPLLQAMNEIREAVDRY